MAKLEGKIRELEAELASTQSRTGEAAKALQRAERKAKELAFAQGEDRKNQDRMSDLAAKLQGKIKPTSNRLRRLKRLLLSTWPSLGRLNKSLRRLRRGQSSQWFCKQLSPSRSVLLESTFSEIHLNQKLIENPCNSVYPQQ